MGEDHLRHQLDRKSDAYLKVYKQRTAVERIFSQAKALGIERPKLRNYYAIANLNTMIYLHINLRAMQQVLQKQADNEFTATRSMRCDKQNET